MIESARCPGVVARQKRVGWDERDRTGKARDQRPSTAIENHQLLG